MPQVVLAATSHFERALNVALKFTVGYRFGGGVLILAVVIATRIDVQVVEAVVKWMELMGWPCDAKFLDNNAESIRFGDNVTGEDLRVGFDDGADLLDDVARFAKSVVIEIS